MNQYFYPEFFDLDGFKNQIELLINIKTHFKIDIIEKTLEEIQKELQSTAYNNHLTLTIDIKQNPNDK